MDFESIMHWFEPSIPHHMEAHCLSKREIIAELYPTPSVLPYGISRDSVNGSTAASKSACGGSNPSPEPSGRIA
jgi:hypothetical protein